ncbi:DUF6249 domain-containing protein [Permianibacter aggregans]|uniref:DUF6249 domain-containing protein n=1 Tax=Permianibacter aggregans TaxID=1510150 RepID=A0A4R6UQI0_9GAMM|nr:DUF6249 domain-containing protein [Permianibacter aggregans]QGX39986.1 hypothetical protein E2H98_10060 [Permianibacter aggregans]TDQ49202.1 hypothetical protein EV696_105176 [Permianibacter aggregans]
MLESLIPIIIVPTLFICAAWVAGWAISHRTKYLVHARETLNKERLTALEKGVNLPILEAPKNATHKSALKTGIIMIAAGAGIALMSLEFTDKLVPIGLLVGLIGVGNIVYWFLEGKKEWQARVQWEQSVGEAYLTYLHELTASIKKNGSQIKPAE